MSLSRQQDRWYWRMWGSVVKHCKANGIAEPDRHDLHRRALTVDKSHSNFDDDDFDDVMSAFYSIAEPANLQIQIRFANMRRTRRVYACRRNALKIAGTEAAAENYIRSVCGGDDGSKGRFHTWDWEHLELDQLRQLRDTLADRIADHRPETIARRKERMLTG